MMRARQIVGRCLACGFAAMLLGGCGKAEPEATVDAPEDVPLARVGAVSIREADVAVEIERRQQRGQPVESAAAVLQELVERQAMLNQAEQDERMQDPAVRREVENLVLAQWLDRTLRAEKDAVTVGDEALRALYEARRDAFTQPAMMRLAVLYRAVDARDAADRSRLAAELAAARQAYLADPDAATREGRLSGFGVIAADASEDTVSRYRGGDLGWVRLDQTAFRLPAAVLQAGAALAVGEVSEVQATEDAVFVVMKSDQRPERVVPFEEARISLRRDAIRARQEAVEASFRSNLLAQAGVEINQEKVAQLTLPVPARSSGPELVPLEARGAAQPPVLPVE